MTCVHTSARTRVFLWRTACVHTSTRTLVCVCMNTCVYMCPMRVSLCVRQGLALLGMHNLPGFAICYSLGSICSLMRCVPHACVYYVIVMCTSLFAHAKPCVSRCTCAVHACPHHSSRIPMTPSFSSFFLFGPWHQLKNMFKVSKHEQTISHCNVTNDVV